RVDPDDGFVGAADVLGIDGEVGHAPRDVGVVLEFALAAVEALLDGVLVGARKGGADQLAHIGMALAHAHAREAFVEPPQVGQVGKIQARLDSVAVHAVGYVDGVAGGGGLAVPDERPLAPVRAGHQAQLGGGGARAPVVVGVQGDNQGFAT